MCVAELDEPCLLGLNYLTQSKGCVDLGRNLIGCVKVVVAEGVHLAPRPEAMHGAEGMMEPMESLRLADGVEVGRSLDGAGGGASYSVGG